MRHNPKYTIIIPTRNSVETLVWDFLKSNTKFKIDNSGQNKPLATFVDGIQRKYFRRIQGR
jgi:hypothetical protein